MARIREVNPTLHVVLEINPDAWDIAAELDRERKAGRLRRFVAVFWHLSCKSHADIDTTTLCSRLHGLPVLIKGNIGTKDRMKTAGLYVHSEQSHVSCLTMCYSAGSIALYTAQVKSDSTIAAKLRASGAIILGKTSLSEWANFRSWNASNGWNAEGGQTYGAYYPKQDPEGSSSGSGVAADLGLALAAIGTETSGSILSPSELNNIVGIKPSVGLTSRYMVIPISERQDTVGPMARTVKDAARLLQVIAGTDPKDSYTLASPFRTSGLPDYEAACKLSGLQGKRIGIPHNVIYSSKNHIPAPIISAFEAAIPVLAAAGAIIVDNANFTAWETYLDSPVPKRVLCADFISNLASYLSNLETNPNNLHTLQDIRTFTQQSPPENYPSLNTSVWDDALEAGINNTSPEFEPLYQQNLYFGGEGGVLGAIARHDLDAVILPTSVSPEIPALVGTPVITVPLGGMPDRTEVKYNSRGDLVDVAPGVPFGISFLGKMWSEEALIGKAYAFEQRTNARAKLRHYIEPSIELGSVCS